MTQETKSVAGLLALLTAAVSLFLAASPSSMSAAPQAKAEPVPASHIIVPKPRVPRRRSLDPALFRDPDTRKAYQIARDNPQLLEKMACYCGCMTSPAPSRRSAPPESGVDGHTSNYECFVDNHGAGCALCRRIALEAQQMQSLGTKVATIKREIDGRYAR
jgi:hypothetical protein